MLQNELIVCFANLSWDFLWLRHQEIMARFARAGNRVLFVEPIGIRMPKWQDRKRIVARLKNRQRAGARGIRQVMENVWVMDPLVNPFQEIGFVHRRNVRALTKQLQNAISQIGGGESIIWTYVPTLLAREVIAKIPHKLVAYDIMDALTENPKGVFASYWESEKILSCDADIVFVTSHTLLERQRTLNPRTYYVPHGVAYEKFADVRLPLPSDLEMIPAPRVLFFGGIDERLDLDLLEQIAAHHPDWHIILLGIVRTDISRLETFSNVHVIGQKPHDVLPAYLHHANVLMMPYRLNAYSQYMNPAKLHECLAVGKPTVVTALPCFDEFRDVLAVATTRTEFEELVACGIVERSEQARLARQVRARENTWEKRFAEINLRLEERLN
jgi:glycosyltransferase involved in cell wall biosynthesis